VLEPIPGRVSLTAVFKSRRRANNMKSIRTKATGSRHGLKDPGRGSAARLAAEARTGRVESPVLADRRSTGPVAGAQLVERAISILNYLGDVGEKGVRGSQLAAAVGLTPSTAYRIIAALERQGFIEREKSTRRYRLGLSLFALGAKAADGAGLRRLCRPALLRLAAATGDTVFLMARSGFNTICVDRQEGTYMLDSLTKNIGGQIPLGVGPASQAILAFLPQEEAEVILGVNAQLYKRFKQLTADEIRGRLPRIREQGFALDHGRLVEGVSALALPIVPKGRDVVASLALNMTSSRLATDRLPDLISMLKQEVNGIERELSPFDVR
jgi:DNA-binding IclR family transcriptional regulator